MRDNNQRTVKIELLSQWKLEAEFRNFFSPFFPSLVHTSVGSCPVFSTFSHLSSFTSFSQLCSSTFSMCTIHRLFTELCHLGPFLGPFQRKLM